MMKAMLTGAGIGAGVNLIRGKDPLQGAVLGGAGGALAGGINGGSLLSSGAGATGGNAVAQGASHLGANMATSQAVTPSILQTGSNVTGGGLFDNFGTGLKNLATSVNDTTGMENKDWTMLGLSNIDRLTPEQQQAIAHANMPPVQGNPNAAGGQVNSLDPIEAQAMSGRNYPNFLNNRIGG